MDTDPSFKTDTISQEPLKESQFISKKQEKVPLFPFWMSFLIVLGALLLGGLGVRYFVAEIFYDGHKSPFLEVRNREFSLFLMQHPEYMRQLREKKTGYLPGFGSTKVTPDPTSAELIVKVPPEILYRYHTWKRLLYKQVPKSPINPKEFKAFLKNLPEWDPKFWANAPSSYKKLVKEMEAHPVNDLSLLNYNLLPLNVRWAFYGWKSYFFLGEKINTFKPSDQEIQAFLKDHPHYKRPYWRNLYSSYLESLKEGQVTSQEIPPFLKVALYYDHKEIDSL